MLDLENEDKKVFDALIHYCPELLYKGKPKNRDYFFNVLNTLKPNIMKEIIHNAVE